MKAVRLYELGGPEVLRLEDTETPRPGPGQVLIKVEAAGVNFADLMHRAGRYLWEEQLPMTLGVEVAGAVVAHGPDVTTPASGTRVAAMAGGGYAEYAVANARALSPIPDWLDAAGATAFLMQGQTAYQTLRETARIEPKDSVLVHAAAGGVGTLAVQIARLLGAGRVIATASTAAKLALARDLGADVAIDYTEDSWPQRVQEATDGKGVRIILDGVGGEIGRRSLACLTPSLGRMVVHGWASGEVPAFTSQELMGANASLSGYWLTGHNWLSSPVNWPAKFAQASGDILAWASSGALRPVVEHRYPLAEAARAHREMGERKTVGKLVLLP